MGAFHSEQFGPGDRFQLIVGWPLDVRATGRQVIKTGGDYNAIQQLIDDQELVQVRKRWAESLFQTARSGNDRMQRSRRSGRF